MLFATQYKASVSLLFSPLSHQWSEIQETFSSTEHNRQCMASFTQLRDIRSHLTSIRSRAVVDRMKIREFLRLAQKKMLVVCVGDVEARGNLRAMRRVCLSAWRERDELHGLTRLQPRWYATWQHAASWREPLGIPLNPARPLPCQRNRTPG